MELLIYFKFKKNSDIVVVSYNIFSYDLIKIQNCEVLNRRIEFNFIVYSLKKLIKSAFFLVQGPECYYFVVFFKMFLLGYASYKPEQIKEKSNFCLFFGLIYR